MNREDIIRMAREADHGFEGKPDADGIMANSIVGVKAIERFAALVAAHEREACARVCEEVLWPDSGRWAVDFAAAIRSRGEVKP